MFPFFSELSSILHPLKQIEAFTYKCSHLQVFSKIGVLKTLAIFTEKRDTNAGVFRRCFEYCEILKNGFFIEHLWWLLLDMVWLTLQPAVLIKTDLKVDFFEKFSDLFKTDKLTHTRKSRLVVFWIR